MSNASHSPAAPGKPDFFSSLDFPGRTTLLIWEIAKRLGVSEAKLHKDLDTGELSTLDLKDAHATKRCLRVPIEAYHDYILRKLTGPGRPELLKTLPEAVRRELIREIQESLESERVRE